MPDTSQHGDQALEALAKGDILFDSIGDGALLTDGQGRISRVNQVALDIFGYTVDEMLGQWYPGFIVAEDEDGSILPTIDRPITRAFLTGKPVSESLYYRRKSGARVPLAITISPVLVDDRPVGALEVFRDISKEVELDRTKSEFISIASHQLRTPASGVKQYLGMVLEGFAGELTPEQREFLEQAYESNERQLTIVDDLLRVAHVDGGKVELKKRPTDVCDLVQSVIEEQSSTFSRRHQIMVYKPPSNDFVADVDPDKLRMVIENLIDNASKYTPEGKKISVAVKRRDTFIDVEVKDEGVGIDPKDLGKMFMRFSRIDNPLSTAVGGTGLGLYWAKRIADLHGGTITLQSRLGKGSTFCLSVPSSAKRLAGAKKPKVAIKGGVR